MILLFAELVDLELALVRPAVEFVLAVLFEEERVLPKLVVRVVLFVDKEVGAVGFGVKDRVGRAGLHQLLEIILFRQVIIYCFVGDP